MISHLSCTNWKSKINLIIQKDFQNLFVASLIAQIKFWQIFNPLIELHPTPKGSRFEYMILLFVVAFDNSLVRAQYMLLSFHI